MLGANVSEFVYCDGVVFFGVACVGDTVPLTTRHFGHSDDTLMDGKSPVVAKWMKMIHSLEIIPFQSTCAIPVRVKVDGA